MLGGYSDEQREHFWRHCKNLDAWKDHPIFEQDGLDLRRLLPVTLHGDGAVMKREDECFVFSMGSIWSSAGCIQDVLMTKWPIAIIPERFMRSNSEPWFNIVRCVLNSTCPQSVFWYELLGPKEFKLQVSTENHLVGAYPSGQSGPARSEQ